MPLPDAKDYALSRAAVLNEGCKGLLAVHGGAIAAMLAFASQGALRSQTLLQAVFLAVAIFAFGLTLALLVPHLRFINSKAAEVRDQRNPKAQQIQITSVAEDRRPEDPKVPSRVKTASWYAYTACQYLSVVAFLAGALIVALVGYNQSAPIHMLAVACK